LVDPPGPVAQPCGFGPVAQLVEQGTFNPKVAGSIPARPIEKVLQKAFCDVAPAPLAGFEGTDGVPPSAVAGGESSGQTLAELRSRTLSASRRISLLVAQGRTPTRDRRGGGHPPLPAPLTCGRLARPDLTILPMRALHALTLRPPMRRSRTGSGKSPLPVRSPLRRHFAVYVLVEAAGVRARVGPEAAIGILDAALLHVGAVGVGVSALARI
jgi:hypothetical protein